MRYIILGAGAIGGGIGAFLHLSGADVTLIARGAHRDVMQRDGLRLRTPQLDVRLPVHVVGSPGEATFSGDEVVILTTKTQDSEAALDALLVSAGPQVPVFCAQNGVENERLAARRFENVYAVSVQMPAGQVSPGEVQVGGSSVPGAFDIGRYTFGATDVLDRVRGDFEHAGFEVRINARVLRAKYGKLLVNLYGVLPALCGPAISVPELSRELRSEGERALVAAGIEHATLEEALEGVNAVIQGAIPGVERAGRVSTWQSAATGRPLETPWLNGEIVLLGALHGVATPANRVVTRLAIEASAERRQPGWITPDEISALISKGA